MKHLIITLLAMVMVAQVPGVSHASRWDDAGKALAVIGGLRLLTGGEVDPIGNIAGINKDRKKEDRYERSTYRHRKAKHKRTCKKRSSKYRRGVWCSTKKVWVPEYVWHKKYIPEQTAYDEDLGRIRIDGHYVHYKVESGGYWKYEDVC